MKKVKRLTKLTIATFVAFTIIIATPVIMTLKAQNLVDVKFSVEKRDDTTAVITVDLTDLDSTKYQILDIKSPDGESVNIETGYSVTQNNIYEFEIDYALSNEPNTIISYKEEVEVNILTTKVDEQQTQTNNEEQFSRSKAIIGNDELIKPTDSTTGTLQLELKWISLNNPQDLDFGPMLSDPEAVMEVNYKSILYTVDGYYKPGDLELLVPCLENLTPQGTLFGHFEVVSDAYTVEGRRYLKLVNKEIVGPGSQGSFNVAFNVPLKDTSLYTVIADQDGTNHGYVKDDNLVAYIQGKVTGSDVTEEVISNNTANKPLSFSVELIKDKFNITKRASSVDDTILGHINDTKSNYYWINYIITVKVTEKNSWKLQGGEIIDVLPQGAELIFVRDNKTQQYVYKDKNDDGTPYDNSQSKFTYNETTRELKGSMATNYSAVGLATDDYTIQIRFPKNATFTDASKVTNNVDLNGYYIGENADNDMKLLAQSSVNSSLKDFNFTYSGNTYAMTKSSATTKKYVIYGNMLDKVPVSIGPDVYSNSFDLSGTKTKTTEPIDYVIGDDLRLWYFNNADSQFTPLEDKEHYVETIKISYSQIGTGGADLYIRKEGDGTGLTDYTFYKNYNTSSQASVRFTKEDKVVSFYVVYRNVTTTFTNLGMITSKEFLNKKDATDYADFKNKDPYQFSNIAFMDVWQPGTTNSLISITPENYGGSLGQEIAQYDVNTYGHYLYRSMKNIDVYFKDEIPEINKRMTYDKASNTITGSMYIIAEKNEGYDFIVEDKLPANVKLKSYKVVNGSTDKNFGYNYPELVSFDSQNNNLQWVFHSNLEKNEVLSQTTNIYYQYDTDLETPHPFIRIDFELYSTDDWSAYRGSRFPNTANIYSTDRTQQKQYDTAVSIPKSETDKALDIQKMVSIDKGISWKTALNVKVGKEFDYRLTLTNRDQVISGLVAYDTLPYVGDVWFENQLIPRNSGFSVNLANSDFRIDTIQTSELNANNAKIYFSTKTVIDAGAFSASNTNWVLKDNWNTDLNSVRGIAVVFNEFENLKLGETVSIIFSAKTENKNINGKTAYNTYHYSYTDIDKNLKISESNAVIVKAESPTYSIGDTVFVDRNNNGFKDLDEIDPIYNVRVDLYKLNEITSQFEKIDTKAVASNGLYTFTGLIQGTYYVKVNNNGLLYSGFSTTINTENSDNQKHYNAVDESGKSKEIVFIDDVSSPTYLHADAGLIMTVSPPVIDKDHDGTSFKKGDSVTFKLDGVRNTSPSSMENFSVVDNPDEALELTSLQIPAFTKGSGLAYTVEYTTINEAKEEVTTIVDKNTNGDNLDAGRVQTLQFTSSNHIKSFKLNFGTVPEGFAQQESILSTFTITRNGTLFSSSDASGNYEAINKVELNYSIYGKPGKSTDEDKVVVPKEPKQPIEITKQARQKTVEVGEAVSFEITKVANLQSDTVKDFTLVDEPIRNLTWTTIDMPAFKNTTLQAKDGGPREVTYSIWVRKSISAAYEQIPSTYVANIAHTGIVIPSDTYSIEIRFGSVPAGFVQDGKIVANFTAVDDVDLAKSGALNEAKLSYVDQDGDSYEAKDEDSVEIVEHPTYSIGDTIFVDRNNNGLQDENENDPVYNISVDLYKLNETTSLYEKVDSQSVGSDGKYLFSDLVEGTYYVQVNNNGLLYSGFSTTINTENSDDQKQYNTVDSSGKSKEIVFKKDESMLTYLHADAGVLLSVLPPVIDKDHDGTSFKKGESVTFKIDGVRNTSPSSMENFSVVDNPDEALELTSLQIPAFTKGSGLAYTVEYTTINEAKEEVTTIVDKNTNGDSLDAGRVQTLQFTSSDHIKSFKVNFGTVPEGFAQQDSILSTFTITRNGTMFSSSDASGNYEAINKVELNYSIYGKPGKSTDEDKVVVPKEPKQPIEIAKQARQKTVEVGEAVSFEITKVANLQSDTVKDFALVDEPIRNLTWTTIDMPAFQNTTLQAKDGGPREVTYSIWVRKSITAAYEQLPNTYVANIANTGIVIPSDTYSIEIRFGSVPAGFVQDGKIVANFTAVDDVDLAKSGALNEAKLSYMDQDGDSYEAKDEDSVEIAEHPTYVLHVDKYGEDTVATKTRLVGTKFNLERYLDVEYTVVDTSFKTQQQEVIANAPMTFINIDEGYYILSESYTLPGYDTIQPIKFSVLKNDGNVATIVNNTIALKGLFDTSTQTNIIINKESKEKINSNLKIRKVDRETNTSMLNDYEFELYYADQYGKADFSYPVKDVNGNNIKLSSNEPFTNIELESTKSLKNWKMVFVETKAPNKRIKTDYELNQISARSYEEITTTTTWDYSHNLNHQFVVEVNRIQDTLKYSSKDSLISANPDTGEVSILNEGAKNEDIEKKVITLPDPGPKPNVDPGFKEEPVKTGDTSNQNLVYLLVMSGAVILVLRKRKKVN